MGEIMEIDVDYGEAGLGVRYDDEVLNANWLPCLDQTAGQLDVEPHFSVIHPDDVDSFLAAVYRFQE